MGLDFINRIIRTSLILAALQYPFVALYVGWQMALGIMLGCAWGAVNLVFIKYIIVALITPNKASKRRIMILAAIKFPLLYAIGYLLLKVGYFTPMSLLIGFTMIFLVTFLKALGRFLIDNKIIATDLPYGSEPDSKG